MKTNKPTKMWILIGIVVDIDKDSIVVSLVDPATKDIVYKVIPNKDVSFICSENDYVKVVINEYIDGSTDYTVKEHSIKVDEKKRAKIVEGIKVRVDGGNII